MNKKLLAVVIVIAVGVAVYWIGFRTPSTPIELKESETAAPAVKLPTAEIAAEAKSAENNFIEAEQAPATAGASQILREIDTTSVDQKAIDDFLNANAVHRYRMIEIDNDLLNEKIRDGVGTFVELSLFDDTEVVVEITMAKEHTTGPLAGVSNIWGSIKDGGEGSFINLGTAYNGMVRANLGYSGGRYFINPLGDAGNHIVWQMDPDLKVVID